MQPADTVRVCASFLHAALMDPQALTRVYNQPTTRLPNGTYIGTLYKNPIDCLWKTLKTEGPLAWYKGEDPRTPTDDCRTHSSVRVDRSFP